MSLDQIPGQGSDQEQLVQEPAPTPDENSWSDKKNEIKEKIIKELHTLKPIVVVYGEPGVGKTQIAREVSLEILKHEEKETDDHESLFCLTLWLSLNKKYVNLAQKDTTPLLEDLARQLSVLPSVEGGFDDDDDTEKTNKGSEIKAAVELVDLHEGKTLEMIKLEGLISKKLEAIIGQAPMTKSGKKKRVLLTLDGAPETMPVWLDQPPEAKLVSLKTIVSLIDPLESLRKDECLRVLVTRRSEAGDREKSECAEFKVEALGESCWMKLLGEVAEEEKLEFVDENVIRTVFFGGNNKDISHPPAAAMLVVRALSHNFEDNQLDASKKTVETALKEAGGCPARLAFDTLPNDDAAMIECCWHSKKFFGADENRSVHYNELIASWILEGYFDGPLMNCSVETAYAQGYLAFERIMARGLLKAQEGEDFVAMESLALAVPDRRITGFNERSRLGLPDFFAEDRDDWRGFGPIAVADGMLKSVHLQGKDRAISTIFVDGERLGREVAAEFFGSTVLESLETLVVTNPRLKNVDFLSNSKKLKMLVLRGCDNLENIDAADNLASLAVLEVSGAKCLERLSDSFFEKLTNLRSLNLAGSRIESLPSSFEKLTRLRWLVLRDCSELEEIPSLKYFKDLEVLNVSGVSSLKIFKNKNFGELKKLRALDFSGAKSAPLPFVHSLTSLTRLTLKDCEELTRLPMMTDLTNLRVFEVSGAKKLKEFYNPCLENKPNLEILDISGSALTRLPPSFNHLPKLEILNLSNMSFLEDFKDISFVEFKSLKSLDVSFTNVETIPNLSNLENLKVISMRECRKLESFPAMEGLKSLEEIDLSGATELKEIKELQAKENLPGLRRLLLKNCVKLEKIAALKGLSSLEVLSLSGCEALRAEEIENQPFDEMVRLKTLDLSGTKVKSLKVLHRPINLQRLFLENCINLMEIPGLESLSMIEELNLSGTKNLKNGEAKKFSHMTRLKILNLSETSILVSSGDFSKCTKLKELSLRGCALSGAKLNLETLPNIEVLDLSETSIASPENKSLSLEDIVGIEKLSRLRRLELWGCEAKSFPNWISGLTRLETLRLPDLKKVKTLDWGLIKRLPNDLNWEECGILEIDDETPTKPSIPSISLTGAKIFEALENNSAKWDKNFAKFCIYMSPLAGTEEDDEVYRLREDKFFENLYLETIHCPEIFRKRFLEIRGFKSLPESLTSKALGKIDCLSLIDNEFIENLSDLGAESFDGLTGLWLEKCDKIKTVFSGEKCVKLSAGFRILWVSNLPSLERLYKGNNAPNESFKNLVELYLDCCPLIEYIFTAPSLPESLEKLEVKFCEKLRGLVEITEPSSSSSTRKLDLPSLREISLLELPEMSWFGVKFQSLQKAKINGCPKLEKQSFVDSFGCEIEIDCVEERWEGIVTQDRKIFSPSFKKV